MKSPNHKLLSDLYIGKVIQEARLDKCTIIGCQYILGHHQYELIDVWKVNYAVSNVKVGMQR